MVRTSYVAGGTTYNIVNDIFRNENILNRLLGTKTDCFDLFLLLTGFIWKRIIRNRAQKQEIVWLCIFYLTNRV